MEGNSAGSLDKAKERNTSLRLGYGLYIVEEIWGVVMDMG